MQRQSFGTYEDRTLANLKMIEGEGSTATLENLGTGDKRTYRLAIEMTNYEFRRFTDYYGRDPKTTDIADLVAIDMEKEKKSKGFGVTIDDDETSPFIGLWSNDNKGNFPRFYASLIGKTLPGFDVITAGAKLTKDRLVSVDRRVSDAQHSMRFLPPKEGETYVDQLIRQKGLLNLDETISTIGRLVPIQTGKVPDIQANFTPVPELVYLAASIDGADQISIALAQAENHLNSTNSTVQQVVKSYGLKEKVDILRKAYEANKVKNIAIGDLIDSTGDTYLSLAWKTDPKNMTYNQRLRGALIASNRDEVNRAASVPANIDFNPNNNLNTKPPEGIDINNLQPIGDKPTPTPTGRIASGSPYWSGPTPEVKQEQYKGVDIYGKEGQILGLTRDNDGMVRKEYWENKGEPQVIYGFPEGPEGRRKFKEEAPELAKEFNL